MTVPASDAPIPESVSNRPGAVLRRAREAQGLSVADVAQSLKFSERQIEAIECDDFDSLHGPAFLRGFARSYAKFLRLNSDEILEMMALDVSLPAVTINPPGNMGDATPRPPIGTRVKWLAAALLVMLLVAATTRLWLPALSGIIPAIAVLASLPTATPHVAMPLASPVASPIARPVAPASHQESPPIQAAVPDQGAAPGQTTAAETPATPPSAPATVASEGTQIDVDFDQKSWVEIKDAGNNVILTGDIAAGTHKTVSGRPPFQLWIGNAPGVRARYRGQPVDFGPYIREGVARLTLQ